MSDPFEIRAVTLAELRSDNNGRLASEIAGVIQQVFSEPPWHENYTIGRLNLGLGVALMRKNPILYIATRKSDEKVIGYLLGQELLRNSDDPRNQTLYTISGTDELNYLLENDKRVFYVSGVGVYKEYRGSGIATRLSMSLIEELRRQKYDYRLGRTHLTAAKMRNLYAKQGFVELPIMDANHPDRSYWLLKL
jgi:ribosomal protein S18 acetylase RimI-like enzyme